MLKKAERCGMWCCYHPRVLLLGACSWMSQVLVVLILFYFLFLDGQPILEMMVFG